MTYHHNTQLHKRQVRSKRFLRFAQGFLLVIVLLGLYLLFDWIYLNFQNSSVASTGSESTVRSASINIFRTPHFQFQADKSWREVAGESTATRYVYRSYSDILVQHELVVEVNDIRSVVLDNEDTTGVMPVEIEENRMRPLGAISPHCREIQEVETNKEQLRLTYEGTDFPCNPDGASFTAVIGLVDGNEFIKHTLEDKTTTYKITYKDVTFSPTGRPLNSIINSFRLL